VVRVNRLGGILISRILLILGSGNEGQSRCLLAWYSNYYANQIRAKCYARRTPYSIVEAKLGNAQNEAWKFVEPDALNYADSGDGGVGGGGGVAETIQHIIRSTG
jgi:hypothetical protein